MAIDVGTLLGGFDYSDLGAAAEERGAIQLKEIENRFSLGKAQIKNSMNIAKLNASVQRESIAEAREYHRGLLAQARFEAEQIGIPDMLIRRFVAEKNYEIATEELKVKRETLAQQESQFAREFGLKEREFGLQTAMFGAELGSQPDRYFQARRFQALDAPRLLGVDTSGVAFEGAPVPQIATLGARLTGVDPATIGPDGQPLVQADQQLPPSPASSPATAEAATAPVHGGPTAPSATVPTWTGQPPGPIQAPSAASASQPGPFTPATVEQDPAKTIATLAKAIPPSPYEGLNEQDAALLKLFEAVYKRGGRAIPGGELERMAATGGIDFQRSAGRLLGWEPRELEAEYAMFRPVQSSSRLA